MADQLRLTGDFQRALELMEAGENVFITGDAGTGKSTLIRYFIKRRRAGRNVVVAAPTGIAALNVGGYTLHRLFSFPPGVTRDDVRSGACFPRAFAKVIGELETLIIDEVSMVRADLFDLVCEALEMYGPRRGYPLGGVQLVLVGDLYQLPPVVTPAEEEYFTTVYENPYFFAAHHYSPELFHTVTLREIFRQQGDRELTELLRAVRSGRVTGGVLSALNRRVAGEFSPPDGEFWLTLAPTNRRVTAENMRKLELLDEQEFVSFAERRGDTEHFEKPTDDELHFKVGAQIMMLTNDPSDRWVNGTLGQILRIWRNEEGDFEVDVRFRDGSEVAVTPHNWDVTRPVADGGTLRREIVGSFRQLPFKLAWAITIHKSQGQTLDRAVIELSGGIFANGQLYVALSRCRSLAGIVLTREIRARDVRVDYRVRRFLADASGTLAERTCALSMRVVGQSDGFIRPIHIALDFGPGSPHGDNSAFLRDEALGGPHVNRFESLVNPARDIGNATEKYGISAADLQVAPSLGELWPAIERLVDGWGIEVTGNPDEVLAIIDAELKRCGIIAPLEPFGLAGDPHAVPIAYHASPSPRAAWFIAPRSRRIVPVGDPQEVARLLEEKLFELPLAPAAAAMIDEFCEKYGVRVTYKTLGEQPDISSILTPGTRVAFTGTVNFRGTIWERGEMEALAATRGLEVKSSVSRTRCDVLIAADVTSLSRKAKNAREFGKPIYAAVEFLVWAEG